jgi:uncharacterized Zn finger protein
MCASLKLMLEKFFSKYSSIIQLKRCHVIIKSIDESSSKWLNIKKSKNDCLNRSQSKLKRIYFSFKKKLSYSEKEKNDRDFNLLVESVRHDV